jgi:hypothetical protein
MGKSFSTTHVVEVVNGQLEIIRRNSGGYFHFRSSPLSLPQCGTCSWVSPFPCICVGRFPHLSLFSSRAPGYPLPCGHLYQIWPCVQWRPQSAKRYARSVAIKPTRAFKRSSIVKIQNDSDSGRSNQRHAHTESVTTFTLFASEVGRVA